MPTLVLQIDHPNEGCTGYPISLRDFDPETGQCGDVVISDEIKIPFPPVADGDEDAIARIGDILRDQGRDQDALAGIGSYLSSIFKNNRVSQQWFEWCEKCDDPGTEVCMRTYLDIRPEELQHLPWELISYKLHCPVFLSDGHRVMRGRPDLHAGGEDIATPLPIRVMVIVCDRSEGLRAEDEVDAIYAGLSEQAGVWQIEVLREPSWDMLKDALQSYPPQILHIIAHTYNPDELAFNVRVYDPDAGREMDPWPLRVNDIDKILKGLKPLPRLLVLNACHTAEMVPADRFRLRGMKGVVATQSEINSDEAVWFTKAFYKNLAKTGSSEDAIWHARAAMRSRRREDHHDWGVPVLTVFGPSANVIRPDLPQLCEEAGRLRSDRYTQTRLLVDRIPTHRRIWGPDTQHDHRRPEKHLVLISGRKSAGKTELIYSCMLTWQLRGSHGVIIDMAEIPESILPADRRVIGAREALMHICDSLSEGLASVGVDPSVCSLLRAQGDILRACDESAYAQVCTAILDILKTMPDEPPLLILLDQLEQIIDGDLHHVISDKLLWPIARNRLDNVYVIATVAEDKLRENILGDLANRWRWAAQVAQIKIDFFKPEQAMSLGREFGARKGWVAEPGWQSCVHDNLAMKNDWPPVELHKLAEVYEAYAESRRRQ